uniref:Uncharacterized protein n=1 Tax=Siphoviridae sp. ctNHg2 TaxID=2825467 RepID=A0A8S5V452_9CAUD|nr:MAG TPA: hypothetical protein [Siphoviridae sp. ctNHg2]
MEPYSQIRVIDRLHYSFFSEKKQIQHLGGFLLKYLRLIALKQGRIGAFNYIKV